MFSRVVASAARVAVQPRVFTAVRCFSTRNTPNAIYYSKDHEYIRFESADVATVGVSDFAQCSLGELVFVDLPAVGTAVSEGQTFAAVESVKSANDVYSPVSGTIVAVNEALADNVALVNEDAENKGWMVKIKLCDAAEVDKLMDPAQYKAFCDAQ